MLALCLLAFAGTAWAQPREQLGEDGSYHRVGYAASPQSIETTAPLSLRGPTRSVAIVASASANLSEPWFTVPRDLLLSSGAFAGVTVIDVRSRVRVGAIVIP